MYNPKAGGSTLPVEDLVSLLEQRGASVLTQDTKADDYKEALDYGCDFIIVAGGDGTIEKVAKKVINKGMTVPIAILPFGNANNIAGSLEVDTAIHSIIDSWEKKEYRKFRVGTVALGEVSKFFFESVGWGLFSEVLHEVEAEKEKQIQPPNQSQDKVKSGMQRLARMVSAIEPAFYQIFIDGEDLTGYYLWVEVMNTQSIGPRLRLAPEAKHGDEYLDVVLIRENERSLLEHFISRQKGDNDKDLFAPIKAQKIKIRTDQVCHVDDEVSSAKDVSGVWVELSLLPESIYILNG